MELPHQTQLTLNGVGWYGVYNHYNANILLSEGFQAHISEQWMLMKATSFTGARIFIKVN